MEITGILISQAPFEITNLESSSTLLVFVGNGEPDINGREDRENIGLDDRNKDVQPYERDGNEYWKDAEEQAEDWILGPRPFERAQQEAQKNRVNEVAGKDIGPEPNREGEQAGRGGDDFHRKKQKSEKPITDLPGGPGKGQKIRPRAMVTDSLPIEIEKNEDSAGQRYEGDTGGRRKNREKTE